MEIVDLPYESGVSSHISCDPSLFSHILLYVGVQCRALSPSLSFTAPSIPSSTLSLLMSLWMT